MHKNTKHKITEAKMSMIIRFSKKLTPGTGNRMRLITQKEIADIVDLPIHVIKEILIKERRRNKNGRTSKKS